MNNEDLLKKAPYHFDELYNFALRMTGSYKKADKMVTHIMREAVKFYEYHNPPDIRKWLLGIAVNLFSRFYKIERKRKEEEEEVYNKTKAPADFTRSEDIFRKIKEKELLKVVYSVPPDLRLILVMKEVLGLDYLSIAELADIPENTVLSRLNRGRKFVYMEIMNRYE